VYFVRLADYLSPRLAPIVAQIAAESINRQVSIGRVSAFGHPGSVYLDSVLVSNHATFASDRGEPAIRAKHVEITYDLAYLLSHPAQPAGAIKLIHLDEPTAYVERLPSGQYNFSDLLVSKNPKKKGVPFLAVVTVSKGTLIARDSHAPTVALTLSQTFRNVAARIDLSSVRVVNFTAAGSGESRYIQDLSVRGQVLRGYSGSKSAKHSPSSQGYGLDIKFTNATLTRFAPYLIPRPNIRVAVDGGIGSGEVTIKQVGSGHPPLAISGSVSVTNAAVRLLGSKLVSGPIVGVIGSAQFTQSSVMFHGMGSLNQQIIHVTGTVLDFKKAQIYAAASGTNLDYQRLRSSIPSLPAVPVQAALGKGIAAQVWAYGSFSKPSIDISAQVPIVTAEGYHFQNVDANFTYKDKVLLVHSCLAHNESGGDNFSAGGTLDVSNKQPTYHFYGQAKSVNVAQLPISASVKKSLQPFNMAVNGVFDVTQNGITASLTSSNGVLHGVPFSAAEGDIYVRLGSNVQIRKFFIRQQNAGILVASGDIPLNSSSHIINLQFRGAQIDLSKVAPAFTTTSTRGLAYIKGTVIGRLSDPAIQSHLLVLQPGFGQYDANLVTADLSGDTNLLKLDRLIIRNVPGTATVTGSVAKLLSRNPRFDLSVALRDISISDLAALQKAGAKGADSNIPVTGFVNGTVSLTGGEKNFVADASLSLEDGTYQDLQLTNTSARLEYYNHTIKIDGVRTSIGGVDIAGAGMFDPLRSTIALDMNATAKDLGVVTQKYAPSLQIFGGLQAAFVVDGTIKNPSVVATVSTNNVAVEGTKLSVTPCTFSYSSDKVSMTKGPFVVTAGDSKYAINDFSYTLPSRQIELIGSESGETLSHILGVIQKSPYLESKVGSQLNEILSKMPAPPVGNLSLDSVDLSGSLDHPTVAVNANLTDAVVSGQKIDRLHTDFIVKSTQVSLTAFQLTGPNNAFLEIQGSLDTSGPINARIEASGFNLSLLDPFLPKKANVGGTLSDLSVVASGNTSAPDISASITLTKPSYAGFALDRIDSGEIDIKDSHLSINGLTFTKEMASAHGVFVDHTMTVEGAIPFQWKKDGFLNGEFPANTPLAMNASIPLQSIDFINYFDPNLPVKLPTGTISGNIKVSGTLADKQVNGNLSLAGASALLDGYQTSLNNVNLNLLLNGKKITVSRFDAVSSAGGEISVAGNGEISDNGSKQPADSLGTLLSDLQLSLTVTAQNLKVNERKIALFENAGLTARINNGVTITGPVLRPVIHGTVDVDNVAGSLPQTTSQPNTISPVPAFNPRFDMTINIKPGAQIKTAQLNALADGSIAIAGSLYRPSIDGNFLIRKGQFYFPTATFKVVPVGTVDFHFRPPDDISELIQMTAVTSITVTPDVIARNPAGANTTSTYVPPSLTQTASSTSQRYTVTVNINGDLQSPDHLHLSFESNPPGLTDAQILAVLGGQQAIAGLTGGNIVTAVQNQVASVFNASVVPKMLQPLEDSIGTVLGLEDFSINYAPESPVQVTIVKRVGSRINVQYTQSVNSRTPGAVSSTLDPPVYQVKVGYSFTPRLQVTISTDDQHTNIVAIEGVHNF
jgi:autotransporter translocation and assembly factor TamB